MKDSLWYPNEDNIIEANKLAITRYKVKKSDKHEVKSLEKIKNIVHEVKTLDGSVKRKSSYLLRKIIQEHPFASGNRRTAVIISKIFLLKNKSISQIRKNKKIIQLLKRIREEGLNEEEIEKYI